MMLIMELERGKRERERERETVENGERDSLHALFFLQGFWAGNRRRRGKEEGEGRQHLMRGMFFFK